MVGALATIACPAEASPHHSCAGRGEWNKLTFPDHVFYTQWIRDNKRKEQNANKQPTVNEDWIPKYQKQIGFLERGEVCGPY